VPAPVSGWFGLSSVTIDRPTHHDRCRCRCKFFRKRPSWVLLVACGLGPPAAFATTTNGMMRAQQQHHHAGKSSWRQQRQPQLRFLGMLRGTIMRITMRNRGGGGSFFRGGGYCRIVLAVVIPFLFGVILVALVVIANSPLILYGSRNHTAGNRCPWVLKDCILAHQGLISWRRSENDDGMPLHMQKHPSLLSSTRRHGGDQNETKNVCFVHVGKTAGTSTYY
jgi:hypothetical protein